MADVITRTEYKNAMGITTTAKDTQIDFWIPIITSEIKEITNNNFIVQTGESYPYTETETYPLALKPLAIQMVYMRIEQIKKPGIQSETQGGYSYTRGSSQSNQGIYPDNIMAGLAQFTITRTGHAQKLQAYNQYGYIPKDRTQRVI